MNTTPPKTAPLQELTLEWIPQPMRRVMDRAEVRISLAQWQVLPLADRQLLARMSDDPTTAVSNFVRVLQSALAGAGAGDLRLQAPAAPKPPVT